MFPFFIFSSITCNVIQLMSQVPEIVALLELRRQIRHVHQLATARLDGVYTLRNCLLQDAMHEHLEVPNKLCRDRDLLRTTVCQRHKLAPNLIRDLLDSFQIANTFFWR